MVLLVQPLVEHGLVLAQSQQTLLMEMISVLQVIDMILWYYRAPKNAVAARETLYTTHSQSVSQLHRGPPRSPHQRLKGRLRSPLSTQVLSTRSLGLLNFASEVGLSQHIDYMYTTHQLLTRSRGRGAGSGAGSNALISEVRLKLTCWSG